MAQKLIAKQNALSNPTAIKLLDIMQEKESNLAVSADVTSAKKLLELADAIGEEICVLKTHIDIIDDFSPDLISKLQTLAEKHSFLLFEDRKFVDIGNTVRMQYQGGIYRIGDWAHITNACALSGPSIVEGLKEVGMAKGRALLLIAELSSRGALTNQDYAKKTLEIAERHPDFVIGFIAQQQILSPLPFLCFTPGVHLTSSNDTLGQQYQTPEQAIEKGADILIVGRGIYGSDQPKKMARIYREAGWQAYVKR